MQKYLRSLAEGLVLAVVAVAALKLFLAESTNQRLQRELRNEQALHDTTRRIAHATFARRAIEQSTLSASNAALRNALSQTRGEVVILAERIQVLQAIDTGPSTGSQRTERPDSFNFGPLQMRLGTLSGHILTRDSTPSFTPVWHPTPLIFDFAVVRHKDAPWEVVVRIQPYDTTTSVRFEGPPVISSSLIDTANRPCRRWYAIVCDGSIVTGVAFTNSLAGPRVALAGIYNTGIVVRPLRAQIEITTEPRAAVFFGLKLR